MKVKGKNINNIIGKCSNLTHVDHKGEDVDETTFEWKGCWNCPDFKRYNFPYYTVKEAAQILGRCPATIRSWIKSGKIKGKLFKLERKKFAYGPRRIYFIEKESVKGY